MNWKELARSLKHWAGGAKKSYSQTGEDLIAEFYLAGIKRGFYVDVGTNDPVNLNNTYRFYKKGWRGLCVEPSAGKVKLIRLRRHGDMVVQVGVGTKPMTMPFYIFDPDTLSTFSEKEAEVYRKLGYSYLGQDSVPVKPLAEILELYASDRTIDLLSVDTEGQDLEVLQSNDWKRFRPRLVITEVVRHRGSFAERSHQDFDKLFESVGYLKIADTNINVLYMEKTFADAKKISSIN
ncbi:MAG: FkbM family methyltransferase [Patescibacteria group bacterium]|nr:FkbM family methyltransferase [Patescibacteria group bacterium]